MKFYFAIIFSVFLLTACNTEVKYQNDIESVVKKAQKEDANFTAEDWENADLKMEKFKEDFDLKKEHMTKEERDKANELIGRYAAVRIKGSLNELKENISDFGKQMEGAMKELTDSTEK
jgi:predicted small secreted protein